MLLLLATATAESYPLSLHDALPILGRGRRMTTGGALDVVKHPLRTVTRRMMRCWCRVARASGWCYQAIDRDRKSTRLNSSHLVISYAVFCLKKKKKEGIDQEKYAPK